PVDANSVHGVRQSLCDCPHGWPGAVDIRGCRHARRRAGGASLALHDARDSRGDGSPRLHEKHPASPDGHADHRTLSVVRRWRGATVAGRDATGGMSVQYAGAGVETVRAGALDATRGTQVAGRRLDLVFLLIIAAALLLRFHLAATREYIHDENNTA